MITQLAIKQILNDFLNENISTIIIRMMDDREYTFEHCPYFDNSNIIDFKLIDDVYGTIHLECVKCISTLKDEDIKDMSIMEGFCLQLENLDFEYWVLDFDPVMIKWIECS